MATVNVNLFGEISNNDVILRDVYIEPPFSVIDTKIGRWHNRVNVWKSIGIKSELGRTSKLFNIGISSLKQGDDEIGISIFDPHLCEVLYKWFCPEGGTILDPFAGGSVRGIVANKLGYKYTGIDIRQEQVESNREQALNILPVNNQPQWYVGNSEYVLDGFINQYDFVFSCPPYFNLEVYSDIEGDISNMDYNSFMKSYKEIIRKSCKLLKRGCLACFVVGEVRDNKGNYIGFVPDTIKAFQDCGMGFYNEAILLNNISSASLRANGNMKSKKLVKVHQNILVFKKY